MIKFVEHEICTKHEYNFIYQVYFRNNIYTIENKYINRNNDSIAYWTESTCSSSEVN